LASDYFFIATAVSFWDNLGTSVMMGGMAPNAMPELNKLKVLIWVGFGAFTVLIGISLILVDVPRPDCTNGLTCGG